VHAPGLSIPADPDGTPRLGLRRGGGVGADIPEHVIPETSTVQQTVELITADIQTRHPGRQTEP